MTYTTAGELLGQLKQKKHIYRAENAGNTFFWFSTHIPLELPLGNTIQHAFTENIPLPHKHHYTVLASLTGWMTFWKHLGGHCSAATAFISVNPKQEGKATASIELIEPPLTTDVVASQQIYGLESDDYLSYLCKGLVVGLQTVLAHPVADLTIRVLNTISDKVDSSPKAFEVLGQRLMEAMIIEMYRQELITTTSVHSGEFE